MTKIIMMTFTMFIGTTMFIFPCFAQDVLYGCYQKNNGRLRIVGNVAKCRASELPIYWNQIGPPGLIWQGPWSYDVTYESDDAVSYNGSSYISLAGENQGNPPDSSPTFWEMLAQKGDIGERGDKGDKGDTGDPGLPGVKGDKGDPGPAGHSPVLTWSGDQIAIDGVLGPNLTGPKGDKGDPGPSGAGARLHIYTKDVTFYIDPFSHDVNGYAYCNGVDEIMESSYADNGGLLMDRHWNPDGNTNGQSWAGLNVTNLNIYTVTATITIKCIGLR